VLAAWAGGHSLLHEDMSTLLEDRSARLFNCASGVLALDHLDIAELMGVFREAVLEVHLFFSKVSNAESLF
jgi:hypothetical protein